MALIASVKFPPHLFKFVSSRSCWIVELTVTRHGSSCGSSFGLPISAASRKSGSTAWDELNSGGPGEVICGGPGDVDCGGPGDVGCGTT